MKIVGSATAAMAAVNQQLDPVALQQTMTQFTNEMEKISMSEETWDDMVDAFDGDEIEEESDQVLNQVLDELGLEVGNSLANISAPPSSKPIANTFDDEVSYLSFFSFIFFITNIEFRRWKNFSHLPQPLQLKNKLLKPCN